MVRLLIGAPLHSDGKLTVVSLATEAGLRRNKLTHKHTGLKDLFYALVKARALIPEPAPETAQARAAKQQKDLARLRAERDDLRSQAQLLARIVQVLEVENHHLKGTNTALEQRLVAQFGVSDISRRRRVSPKLRPARQRIDPRTVVMALKGAVFRGRCDRSRAGREPREPSDRDLSIDT